MYNLDWFELFVLSVLTWLCLSISPCIWTRLQQKDYAIIQELRYAVLTYLNDSAPELDRQGIGIRSGHGFYIELYLKSADS